MGHIHKMLQLIENLANSQSKEVGADPLSIDSLNDRKAKFMEVRSKIINEKIEKMTEGSKLSWESMKNELKSVNEVQSRSLGKKKLNNCELDLHQIYQMFNIFSNNQRKSTDKCIGRCAGSISGEGMF